MRWTLGENFLCRWKPCSPLRLAPFSWSKRASYCHHPMRSCAGHGKCKKSAYKIRTPVLQRADISNRKRNTVCF
ncbi:hypothetical protein TNIN_348141 [Trichonephila inaurata madagascariensis]|uniref:Uncharacterized protein n=1 Tax=Trichonephila inaurata madagascariensis TaxID=2747483 RepID=A0A8X6I9N8_9ARAC|nr:hypothetical protein TNIN_348141 [Trichonephila inaurata madagascariensis]